MKATQDPEILSTRDRTILRDLATEVAAEAAAPRHAERRTLWKKHNALQPVRPLILVFPEGSWSELLPDTALTCEGEAARRMEWQLRVRLYYRDHLKDDTVIEKEWKVGKVVRNSGWGLTPKRIPSTTQRGAWHFDPVIHSAADLKKLKHPTIEYDDDATQANLALAQDLFGDILDIRLVGVNHISFHLMNQYTGLRGLEEVMIDMYAEPEMLHEAMSILEAGHRKILDQYIEQNLLDLNNDSTYHNSGGNGYTDELPPADCNRDRVRLCDMWGSAEAQEMAQVGPEQHAEFVLAYEKRLLEPFGLTGYGCCEPLHDRLDMVLEIPHIRRISISPWTDVDIAAARLGGAAIFSWKPQPAHLVGAFNEGLVRNYIRHTIDICAQHGCHLEMVLKDTHTCENHPERFDRWIAIAREEVDRIS